MITKFPHMLHGCDYNPDQWLDRPDILEEDIRLMHKAHVNCVSLGIFSWARLEPSEGVYDFEWLDEIIERLHKGGINIILATPSAARPAWMAQHHEEVLRVNDHYQRMHFGERHNHCPTSPYYREKVRQMDAALAERYSHHPAVIMWHLGNEFGGECRCPLCQQAFRDWLKEKYGTLEKLNDCWWTSFWSQRYTDWSQIEAPGPLGEFSSCSMWVDWRRFMTHQCCTFVAMERDTVQAYNPELPCTANLMERFWDYDYFKLAENMDIVSWDAYPEWHSGNDIARAAEFAMNHDIMRSLKHKPFLLMESTPSQVNWKPYNKLKRPGMHLLSSLQAVAHGSQSVQYFQWRKGRGGAEMFHGAVVGHDGTSDTRVFRDVQEVGMALEKLSPELTGDMPKIRLGAEVLYYSGISKLEGLSRFCIEGTRFLLLEMPFSVWNEHIVKEVLELSCSGEFHLILAHVERYLPDMPKELFRQLLEYDVIMQSNASFFLNFGTKRKALRMLRDGEIHLIGSDCHNMKSRQPKLDAARAVISKKLGEEFLEFYDERAERFLEGM